MKFLKIISYNILFSFLLIILIEIFFGYWFKKENFGIYMRKERKINWQTKSSFNGSEYNFYYKRNYWGFRGEEFDPKDVEIVFEGGSTGNQRYTPEDLTIVGLLNKKFKSLNYEIKIYNASTDGKSINGYINDFNYWFPKIPNLNIKYVIFFVGINERFIYNNEEEFWDKKISKKKIDQLKDYIKNNSIFVDKFKLIKNKYFPTNTLAYDFNSQSLYKNFKFIDYKSAKSLHKNLNNEDKIFINSFKKKLVKLKTIIEQENIKPIFITQTKFDGLKEKKLFLINNEIKNFAVINKYYLIPLDETIIMGKSDYYDQLHTTPQGSAKISDEIFPFMLNFLKEYNEIRE